MSRSKHPNDQLPESDSSTTDDAVETETKPTKFSLADMKAAVKKGYQPPQRYNAKAVRKGPKVGDGPRGSRRSLGKR